MGRYMGKYQENVERKVRIPLVTWALVLLAVLGLTIGGVTAYLSAHTDPVTNTFVKDEATDPAVTEATEKDDKGYVTNKTDVKVDVGAPGYAVYVRAAVVVTWKDAAGNVLGAAPVAETDYDIVIGDDWEQIGEFYYYNKAIHEGKTNDLIVSCKPKEGKTPAGYGLNVEIIAQTIQAVGQTDGDNPMDAVEDAWGVKRSDFVVETP